MKEDIKKAVLGEIKEQDIKVRSKNFFKVLKLLAGVLLTFLAITSVFIFNLSFYLPRRGAGLNGQPRPIVPLGILNSIPWGLVIFGSLLIAIMIYLYVKYEGGYKRNLLWTVLLIGLGVVLVGGAVSASRFNEHLEKRQPLRRMYDEGERQFVPGGRKRLEQEERRLLPFAPFESEIF